MLDISKNLYAKLYDFSGGWPSQNTFEYIDKFTDTWIIANAIESVRHCMVTLKNGNIVTIGGFKNGQKVDMFDVNLEQWISLPKLQMWADRHDCILLDTKNNTNILIVDRYAFAEVYNVQNGQSEIISGPKFNRGFAKLAKINGEIYLLGGDYHIKQIEKF